MFIDYYRADPTDIAKEITCQLKAGLLVYKAGLLVYKARRGEITHEKVKLEIENHPESERDCLRAWCNHYRRVAVLRGEVADK